MLNRLKLDRGVPKVLYLDDGSELNSQVMNLVGFRLSAKIDFSRPGIPTDNASVESPMAPSVCECLDNHRFVDLKEAKHLIGGLEREI